MSQTKNATTAIILTIPAITTTTNIATSIIGIIKKILSLVLLSQSRNATTAVMGEKKIV